MSLEEEYDTLDEVMSGSIVEIRTGHKSLPRADLVRHPVSVVVCRLQWGYELQSKCPYDHHIQHRDLLERPKE